jgi:hypothetical protein
MQKNQTCKVVSEEIMILTSVGCTQPVSQELLRTAFVLLKYAVEQGFDLDLSLRGYWDQQFYVILQVLLGF